MLSQIELTNFKAFGKKVTIPLAPLTLIYGQNSAGKSSIMDAIRFIHHQLNASQKGPWDLTAETSAINWGDSNVGLGPFETVVHNHDISKEMVIAATSRTYSDESRVEATYKYDNGTAKLSKIDASNSPIGYKTSKPTRNSRVVFQRGCPNSEVDSLFDWSRRSKDWAIANTFTLTESKFDWNIIHENWVTALSEAKFREALSKVGSFDHLIPTKFSKLKELLATVTRSGGEWQKLRELVTAWVEFEHINVNGWNVNMYSPQHLTPCHHFFKNVGRHSLNELIPPLERDEFRCGEANFRPFGAAVLHHATEFLRYIIGRLVEVSPYVNASQKYYRSHEHPLIEAVLAYRGIGVKNHPIEYVNRCLGRLGLGYEIDVEKVTDEHYQIMVVDDRRAEGTKVPISNVGMGVNQLLKIAIAGWIELIDGTEEVDVPKTVLLQQPELHLHPALQAELGSLLAEQMSCHIIETHSEHLMLRIQRLIREKKLSSENVSVLFVDCAEGGSTVTRLRVDEEGDFVDEWPGGFFPERLRELR